DLYRERLQDDIGEAAPELLCESPDADHSVTINQDRWNRLLYAVEKDLHGRRRIGQRLCDEPCHLEMHSIRFVGKGSSPEKTMFLKDRHQFTDRSAPSCRRRNRSKSVENAIDIKGGAESVIGRFGGAISNQP